MDILKPLGLAPEDVKLPLSPRSQDAYARINEEFDMLYSQLQDPGEQAGQNHAEVPMPNVITTPLCEDAVHVVHGVWNGCFSDTCGIVFDFRYAS